MRLSLLVVIRPKLNCILIPLLLLSALPALAQSPVGTRAEGMAGAFVGVADDASAVYWNPAGIATGSFVSAVVSWGDGPEIGAPFQTSEGQQDRRAMVAVSATAVGAAYYRFTAYGVDANPAATASSSREEVGRFVHAITVHTVGVSLLQSISENIVVAATPKFVHGARGNAFDVDAGVMFSASRIRLGLVARNLTTPAFKAATGTPAGEGSEIELRRDLAALMMRKRNYAGAAKAYASAVELEPGNIS